MPGRKFYVTTAIDYVNDRPGLHHAYEKTGADALARFHRQRGDDVFFLTGTDENATRNDRAAKEEGIPTQQLVDRYMTYYKDEPLVRITTEIPEVKDINRSNLVQIGGFGVNSKNDRVIMATTIDNLRKGAAAAALQNINLMLGLNELQNIPPQ